VRVPCEFRLSLGGKGERHILELDMPGVSKYSNTPALGAGLAESDPDCLAGAAIEEGDWGAGINKGAQCPVASVAMLQANVQSGP
jgi:hypothetical protein